VPSYGIGDCGIDTRIRHAWVLAQSAICGARGLLPTVNAEASQKNLWNAKEDNPAKLQEEMSGCSAVKEFGNP